MEFRLLGPLEVRKDGAVVRLAGAKQRALLTILLLHANEVVRRDTLLEALWPDDPAVAAHSLELQVSRLRKALGPDCVVTRPGGYALEVEPGEIDARRFERLLEEGRRANGEGEPAEALKALRDALGLWRGGALSDLAYEPFARVEIDRLEELRLVATEERIDAELALGRAPELVAELEASTAKQPLRERPVGQLMLALYRAGRQADALRAYSGLRRRLVEQLGLEPAPSLQRLEQAILRQDPSLELAPAQARRRRRLAAVGAAVAAIALAAGAGVAGVLLAGGGTQSSRAQPAVRPDSVALLSTASGQTIAAASVEAPLDQRFGLGGLWSVSAKGIVTKADPRTGATLAAVNAVPVPCGLALGAGFVWVTDCVSPTVVKIEPEHGVVVGRFPLPVPDPYLEDATQSVAFGAGSVWVGQGTANPSFVWRLDPRTGRVRARIVIAEGGAESLAFGDGALWVGGGVIGRLSRVDPRTNAVTSPVRDLGSWLCCVAAGGGYTWAAVVPPGRVWKLSAAGRIVSSVALGAPVESLSYADGALWVSTGDGGAVVRIDPATDAARRYRLGHHVAGTAVRGGVLAAAVQVSGRDVTAGLTGRIVTVALKVDDLDWTSTDPLGTQFAFNADQVQFHYATCAKLLDYPDASTAAGARLVPEVAAGWPKVTDGGRTYTFRIRPGFGFSPPSHEQVTAESFRHQIERVLSPAGGGAWQRLADVVGATAFHDGRAAHVAGVTADGDTLVIRLVRPAGDLPARLALPSFCAVPADLPTVSHGLPYPIPTAGPYYLAARSADVFVLKPNPNYHGRRPRRLDAIVLRTGVDPGRAVAAVGRGAVDYVPGQDPALAPTAGAARDAGPRYHLTANNWTERLALNTARPLFADVHVRRAVAAALDRAALARGLDDGEFQLPTADLLPPNLEAGATAPPPPAASAAAARRLLGGRRLHAVLAAAAPATGGVYDPGFVAELRRQLAAIGISVAVIPLRQDSTPQQAAAVLGRADLVRAGGNADDARDVVGFLRQLPYLPAPDAARLDRIAALPYARRRTASLALAARLARDADVIGVSNRATAELVSRRLGCVVRQPEYPGIDLAALCLRP